ncbi:hypothetical protein HDV03_003582 [Kappamyces sp. JEL0829]|nr:hypothetical protein HDV03_003582 [Kappamyces sp. JEL0829]
MDRTAVHEPFITPLKGRKLHPGNRSLDVLSINTSQTALSPTAGREACLADFDIFPDFSSRLAKMDPELVAIFSREQYKARTLRTTERVNQSMLEKKKFALREDIKKQESISLRLKSAIAHLSTENNRLQRMANLVSKESSFQKKYQSQ